MRFDVSTTMAQLSKAIEQAGSGVEAQAT